MEKFHYVFTSNTFAKKTPILLYVGPAITTFLVSIGLFHPSPICYEILNHANGDHGGIPIIVKWRVVDNWELLQGEDLIVMLLALSTLCTFQIWARVT
jgi:hypothetical protein